MDNLVKWTLILLALFTINLIVHNESPSTTDKQTVVEAHTEEAARPL